MDIMNNPIVQHIFYSPASCIIISCTCLALLGIGFSVGGSYQVSSNDKRLVFRNPWLKALAVNALGLYLVWVCSWIFFRHLPLAAELIGIAFVILYLFPMAKFGTSETIQFDLQERTCAHTRGWFRTTRVIKIDNILALDLRTVPGEDGSSYHCHIRWKKGFLGWSEIGSFNKRQPALDFMEDLSQKLHLPLTIT